MLTDSLKAGGKERQLVELLKGLSEERGFKCELVVMDEDIHYEDVLILNIKIRYLIRKTKKDLSIFYKLYHICKEFKPNIIHTWDWITSFYAFPVTKLLGIKMINGSIRHGIRLKKFNHIFRSFIAKRSTYVIANSRAGLIVNRLNNNGRKFILYNGINERFRKKSTSISNPIQAKLNNNIDKKIIFISVSSLTPYKDYFTVIKSLKLLKKSGYKFLYLIIGDGHLKNDIHREIKKEGLIEYIKLIGFQKNVEQYLFISDIFIHSSKGEGASNAILEAMYAGLPIVATDTGGTNEIVSHENGLLFEYKNDNDLYNKLKYLLDNPDIREEFSKESIRIVEEKFTIDNMIKNYKYVINEIYYD